MLPVVPGRDVLLQDRHEFHPSSPGVGVRNDGQTSHVIGRRVEPKWCRRSANCRTTVRFEKMPAMFSQRQAPLVDSTVPDVSQRLAVSLLIQGQPEWQNERPCAPQHTGVPSWRSGWALTTTLTSEATSPLVEPARTASGSHVAKDDRNASLMVLASGRVLPAARTPLPSRTSRQDVGHPVGSRSAGLGPGLWPTRRPNAGCVRRGARTISQWSPWRLANAVTRLALCPDVFNGRYSPSSKRSGSSRRS